MDVFKFVFAFWDGSKYVCMCGLNRQTLSQGKRVRLFCSIKVSKFCGKLLFIEEK